ncbi:disintegrin and metalloproteinase domain-containing protein 9-like isoform X2 [Lissotriton helveticus]
MHRNATTPVLRPLTGFLLVMTILISAFKGFECLLTASEVAVPHIRLGIAEEHTDSLMYEIVISAKKYFISLKKQTLLPLDFAIFINGKLNNSEFNRKQAKNDCYYKGYALDIPNSSVMIRTCSGLRGLLRFGEEIYTIEPLPLLEGFKHLVSRLIIGSKDSISYFQNNTDPESMQLAERFKSLGIHSFKQVMTSTIQTARYMKLAVFVAQDMFIHLGGNTSSVTENVMKILAIVNTKFEQLNIQIFLVLLDIWAESDPVYLGNGTTRSDRFAQINKYIYQPHFRQRRYDTAVLFSYEKSFDKGMTYFGKICSQQYGLIAVYEGGDFETYAIHISHLLGHSIGMKHDNNRTCHCSRSMCIMNQNIKNGPVAMTFSNCSVADFETFISRFGATCLLVSPYLKVELHPSLCGNKWLDEEEECDCGSPSECEDDPCCESSCTFKHKAKCSTGECCKNCQILPRGIECRPLADECDFPEYCDGVLPICTRDFFQQDGNLCNNKQSYCFNGICQNPDVQCKQLFGPDSKAGDASCYLEAASFQDRLETCGGIIEDSSKCVVPDAGCGKIHCAFPSQQPTFSLMAAIQYFGTKNSRCASVEFIPQTQDEKKDLPFLPLLVAAGTKCGMDKLCLEHKCQHISILNLKCDKDTDCNSHGMQNRTLIQMNGPSYILRNVKTQMNQIQPLLHPLLSQEVKETECANCSSLRVMKNQMSMSKNDRLLKHQQPYTQQSRRNRIQQFYRRRARPSQNRPAVEDDSQPSAYKAKTYVL